MAAPIRCAPCAARATHWARASAGQGIFGFGLFGKVDRFAQVGFVLAVWAFQLWISPIWLRSFRFGPAEWLWRTLTYMKAQPMRRA